MQQIHGYHKQKAKTNDYWLTKNNDNYTYYIIIISLIQILYKLDRERSVLCSIV